MNDRELDRLIARANPFGDDTVRQLPTGAAESELLEEIMSTTAPTPELRPTRRRMILLAAAAAAIVVLLTGVLLPRGNPAAPASAYGAEVRAVAEANQRLLLDAPGWKVTRVDEFTAREGEMTFSNGTNSLDVRWRAAEWFVDDRSADEPIQLLGQVGTMSRIGTSSDYATILPPKGQNFLTIRGDLGSEQAYRDLIAKLHPVDVDTWLDAMPASVVKPADTERVVTEMLSDIPVPAGFDRQPLDKEAVSERYTLGARVTGAVSCAWLDQWTKAKKTGDTERMREAVTAMKTSRSWKILREMETGGDYPGSVWRYADAIAKNQTPRGYQNELGC
jgi:hypothetical protein